MSFFLSVFLYSNLSAFHDVFIYFRLYVLFLSFNIGLCLSLCICMCVCLYEFLLFWAFFCVCLYYGFYMSYTNSANLKIILCIIIVIVHEQRKMVLDIMVIIRQLVFERLCVGNMRIPNKQVNKLHYNWN